MRAFAYLLLSSLLTSCSSLSHNQRLHNIHLIDQSDMVQMITDQARLRQWERRDFTTSQPYKKVMRTFERDNRGRQLGLITSYHPNGQLMQLLQISDGRAFGDYREYFESGQLRLSAQVAGGTADLTPQAQAGWLFEGVCTAFRADGQRAGQMVYRKGLREGLEQHFWPTGALHRQLPFRAGRLHGEEREFDENGRLRLTVTHIDGERAGFGIGYWPSGLRAFEEVRDRNRLMRATYWNSEGLIVAKIERGNGCRVVFQGEAIAEKQRFEEGFQRGMIEYFDTTGSLMRRAHFEQGVLTGADTEFYPSEKRSGAENAPSDPQPRLQVNWRFGLLQGPVQTWFPNGQLRSYHERMRNQREGVCTHYYPDGQIKFIENYRGDRLDQGQYFGYRETQARSSVFEGKGTVTLFDDCGAVLEQILYSAGAPLFAS